VEIYGEKNIMPKIKKAVKYAKKVVNYYGKGKHKYIYKSAGWVEPKKAKITLVRASARGGISGRGGIQGVDIEKILTGKKTTYRKVTPSSIKRLRKLLRKAGEYRGTGGDIFASTERWQY